MWDKVQVDDSGNEGSSGISLLDDTTTNTTGFNGDAFEGGGSSQTPDTPHADTEETSRGEKLWEGLNETRAEGEDGDDEEIGDQWPLSPKSVGNEPKDYLCQRAVSRVSGR